MGIVATAVAQVQQVYIQSIEITGHKKTKTQLIRNELSLVEGDSIPLADLMPTLEQNKRYLFNTGLFQSIEIKIAKWEGVSSIHIQITLLEAWYIIPIPQFELADRNFNVWWVQQGRDLRRANIGLWFFWRNLTGYNDLLKTVVQFGYTRKFELDYYLPPMGRKRKFGFLFNALYSDNREINYTTINNDLIFYNDFDGSERQYSRLRFKLNGYYRPNLLTRHQLGLSFLQLNISDSVRLLNPDFFLDGRKTQRSLNLHYSYTLNRRDNQIYPLRGYYIYGSATKQGLGLFNDINQCQLYTNLSYHLPVLPWLFASAEITAKYNLLRQKMPYYNNKALGYLDDFLRGYQYYAIDGQDFLLVKMDINFKVFEFEIPLLKKAPIAYLRTMPVKFHLRYHFDFGYVWDRFYAQANALANTDLIGTGIGLDIILYNYNVIFQIEYSFNKSGENGLYLRYKFHF